MSLPGDDSKFFVTEVFEDDDDDDDEPSVTVPVAQDHCCDNRTWAGMATNGTLIEVPTNDTAATSIADERSSLVSMPVMAKTIAMPRLFQATYDAAINHNTSNIHNTNSSSVNITNIYHGPRTEGTEEEATRQPVMKSEIGSWNEHSIWSDFPGAESVVATSLPVWLRFPTWAIRMLLWSFRSLQVPISWAIRLVLRFAFQGAACMLLLGVTLLLVSWALKWLWLLIWSSPYTLLQTLTATTTAPVASLLALFRDSSVVVQYGLSPVSSSPNPPPKGTLPDGCSSSTTSVTPALLPTTALTIPWVMLWADPYVGVVRSVVAQGAQMMKHPDAPSAIAGPLAAAKEALGLIEEAYESSGPLRSQINRQLAREMASARQLEQSVRRHNYPRVLKDDVQAMLDSQEAEAREARRIQLRQRGGCCCDTGLGWLRKLACRAWRYLSVILTGEGAYDTKPDPIRLKTHILLEKWLLEVAKYMEDVLQARMEWRESFKVLTDKTPEEVGKPWCKISQLSRWERHHEWEKSGDDNRPGLDLQLADLETTSQLACLAHRPIGDHLRQMLSRLEENIVWLKGRIEEARLGYLAGLQGRSGIFYYEGENSDGDGQYPFAMLLTADEIRRIQDFALDSLILQEHLNKEIFNNAIDQLGGQEPN